MRCKWWKVIVILNVNQSPKRGNIFHVFTYDLTHLRFSAALETTVFMLAFQNRNGK